MLYGPFDMDRFENQVRTSLKMPTKVPILNQMRPTDKEVNSMMKKCRNFFDEVNQAKKDVTVEDLQTKFLHET